MTPKKRQKKPLLERLQKYESLIAGTALVIGLALFAGFITTLIIKTKTELDSFVIRTSSTQWENTGYYEAGSNEDNFTFAINPSGETIVEKYMLFTGVYLTADSKGTSVLVDDNNKKINQVVFITDDGDRIVATSSRNGVDFVISEMPVMGFILDGYYFKITEGSVEIDGFKLATFGEIDFSEETTTTTTGVGTTPTITTTPPETTVTEATTTTPPKEETINTTPSVTTTKKPVTTTVTTTKKPQTTTATAYKTDDEFISEVIKLVNEERKKAGIHPLKGMIALDKAATIRAQEIKGNEKNFSHTRPDGNKWYTVFAEAGLSPDVAGENLAAGQTTPEMVVGDWMASQGHKENILDSDFDYIGLGYVKYNGHYYWAQLFASF